MSLQIFAALLVAFAVSSTDAFVTSPPGTAVYVHQNTLVSRVAAMPQDDDTATDDSTPSIDASLDATIERLRETSPTAKLAQQPEVDYPLNVPSPILLASSMVLAIASIGTWYKNEKKEWHTARDNQSIHSIRHNDTYITAQQINRNIKR